MIRRDRGGVKLTRPDAMKSKLQTRNKEQGTGNREDKKKVKKRKKKRGKGQSL